MLEVHSGLNFYKTLFLIYLWFAEHWENHVDLPEIIALQGRAAEEEGAGERDDDEDGESSTEPEEERDRDADDDEDGDDEDEGCRDRRQKNENPPGFTVNIFNVLRENECEWEMTDSTHSSSSDLFFLIFSP